MIKYKEKRGLKMLDYKIVFSDRKSVALSIKIGTLIVNDTDLFGIHYWIYASEVMNIWMLILSENESPSCVQIKEFPSIK